MWLLSVFSEEEKQSDVKSLVILGSHTPYLGIFKQQWRLVQSLVLADQQTHETLKAKRQGMHALFELICKAIAVFSGIFLLQAHIKKDTYQMSIKQDPSICKKSAGRAISVKFP